MKDLPQSFSLSRIRPIADDGLLLAVALGDSPGQYMSTAQSRPSRFVSLKFPSSMWPHITVSQCP